MVLLTYFFVTSAMDHPLCLNDIMRDEKSWRPPMKMVPRTIHKMAGNQPKVIPARIGPTMGPAPAIEEKW